MRQIKFRGKRIDNGKWVYGYYFKTPLTNETGIADSFLSGEEKHQISNNNGCVFEIDKNTLSQFTGLKDKNGKEIYEGDICKVINGGEKEIYQVSYHDEYNYAAFDFTGWDGECNGLSEAVSCPDLEIEVIGNIYENPDLLNN